METLATIALIVVFGPTVVWITGMLIGLPLALVYAFFTK